MTIVAAFAFSVGIGPFDMALRQGSPKSLIVDWISILAINLLAFIWINFDSLERGHPTSKGLRFLIVLLGLLALFIYLIKSRGTKSGLIASAKALGLIFAMFLTSVVSGALVTTILEIPVPD